VLNIFSKLCVGNPEIALEVVTKLTPEATGVSKATIYRLHLNTISGGKLMTTNRVCQATQLCDKCDNFKTCAAHAFFFA
jgi:hypothetical protein